MFFLGLLTGILLSTLFTFAALSKKTWRILERAIDDGPLKALKEKTGKQRARIFDPELNQIDRKIEQADKDNRDIPIEEL